jgi:hypothetical protein
MEDQLGGMCDRVPVLGVRCTIRQVEEIEVAPQFFADL